MARSFFGIEKLLRIFSTNTDTSVDILFGAAAPGGDTGEQDAASVGSLYLRQNGASSTMYQKIGSANNASDWQENGSSSAVIGQWRPEKVRVTTNDIIAVGARDLGASPFADDQGTLITSADFAVGEHAIGDADGSPALFEVTAIAGAVVTFAAAATPMAQDDTFLSINYLPDSPGTQEGQAIVNKTATTMIKIGDVDWNFATGINISSGYLSLNGGISSADSVESAIEKLDGNQQDLQSASGLAQGDTSYGAFASPASLLLAAAQTSKQLFQRLGVLLAQLRGVELTGITTITVVDSVSASCCKWLLEVFEEATPSNRKCYEIYAVNDGTNVDDSAHKLKIGNSFDLDVDVVMNGAAMELKVTSTTAGVTARCRRIEVVKSVL